MTEPRKSPQEEIVLGKGYGLRDLIWEATYDPASGGNGMLMQESPQMFQQHAGDFYVLGVFVSQSG